MGVDLDQAGVVGLVNIMAFVVSWMRTAYKRER